MIKISIEKSTGEGKHFGIPKGNFIYSVESEEMDEEKANRLLEFFAECVDPYIGQYL
jgi:hypothetical protein